MPDEPAGNEVAAKAQAEGADILAQLDELTRQPAAAESAPEGVTLEERKKLAQEAIGKINDIVAKYVAQSRAEQSAGDATENQAEIDRIKKNIGA